MIPMTKKPARLRRLLFEPLEERQMLSLTVPAAYQYNSDTTATKVIYLDFGGETASYSGWDRRITTPVFDLDGKPDSFSTQEWEAIRDITRIVGEYYSSFMVNVTNVYSASTMQKIQNGDGTRILIGGNGAWGGGGTGIALLDTFTYSADIPAFVFSDDVKKFSTYHQKIQTIAASVAHEVGHTLGLKHNSDSTSGEYSNGIVMFPTASGARAYDRWIPMMGGTYVFTYTDNGNVRYVREFYQWSDGNFPKSTYQENSLAKISGILGYRVDDHPGTTVLAPKGNVFSTTGKIERNTDSDIFSFTLDVKSSVTITVAAGVDIAGVQVSSLLHRATVAGTGISPNAKVATADTLTTTHTLTGLAPGTYTITVTGAPVAVANNSKYGSIGSYSLAIVQTPAPPPAPANFHSTDRTYNSVSLAWNAAGASGYVVQFKKASDANWTTASAPTATSTTVTGLAATTDYNFRVRAANIGGESDWVTVNATTLVQPPTTPGSFRRTSRTVNSVTLAWDAASRATGYTLQYKKTTDSTWSTATVANGALTATVSGLTSGTQYNFRVQATNTGGSSNWATVNEATRVLDTVAMPSDDVPHHWALRKSPGNDTILEIIDMKTNAALFTQPLAAFDRLVITASGTANDSLTIDFSNGAFSLDNGIQFNGHAETYDTLYFIGTDGDDSVELRGGENRFNDLTVDTQYVENFTLDGGQGNDQALVVGTESNNSFNVSDNLLVMVGGGYRMELGNFNTIDAIAKVRNDRTFLYGENDSLIVMNEIYVERRTQNQTYRVWYSEQVTAINTDDTNNAILLSGSRGNNAISLTQGYGTVTNTAGSYFHEFIGFDNVIVPFAASTASSVNQPAVLETEMQPVAMETSVAAKQKPAYAVDDWDKNLFAFLADEQMRLQRKKETYHEADDWLAEFAKLALLDLRK